MALPDPSTGVAVVTGASSGIGEALATELARRGYDLLLVARRAAVMQALGERLAAEHGVSFEVRGVDLSRPEQRAPLVAELTGRPVSVLCANAGVATFGPVATLDHAVEREIVELNATAVHDLVLAVLPGMLERAAGGILVTGSAAGNLAVPHNATYAATKAFVNTFAESLRGELGGTGVHVTLLAPGPVRAELDQPVERSVVDRLVPDAMWVTTEMAARVSLDGLARNEMRVVPGIVSKVMSLSGAYLPRRLTAPVIGAFYRKMGEG
ncbi:mycolate reductase [Rhodococcus aerolatus]